MSDDKDRKLDELLGNWDAAQTRSSEDLNELRGKITTRLAEEDLPSVSMRTSSWKTIALATCGIAAAIVIAVSIRYVLPKSGEDPVARVPSASHFAAISADELSDKRQLLVEVQRLFDSQLAGVVEIGDDVRIDVQGETSSPDEPFLAIRVAMVKRKADDEPWQLAWTVDALSRDQRLLSVEPTAPSSDAFSMWAYRLPDGTIAVDVDAQLPSGKRIQSRGSCVLQPGQPTPVLFAQHDGTQYCVYQTVTLVGPDAT